MLRRWVTLVSGLFLFALALVLGLQSGLGAYSWVVFQDGLARHTVLTVGQASIAVSAIVVGVSWLLGVPPGIGTLANLVLIGVFMDVLLWLGWVPEATSFVGGAIEVGLSVILLGIATGMYSGADFGAGPRDSLMLALARRTGWSVSWVRWALEVSVTIAGIVLGGSFGVGTIVVALTVGPAVRLGFYLFGLDAQGYRRNNEGA
ncbi:membrane protein [Thermomicrobium sp. 4228-Ro]|uniref:YczE/YyaS/YitT family protein n=1 Tax=Thermomicrobium sp. 4228-Ro TaxID=2993937 RepID=UPI0022496952|nr:membrane protein [Thermomicrobium sp. 4228-Ro]MCX2726921.1 membrane protein [Thermomicrobium sp. 4228-Ro]